MATSPATLPADEGPQVHAMRLSDLVGALSREFVAASASHHATLNHWKQVYEDSPVLSDFHPDGMKIVSATLSVPVALSQVSLTPRPGSVSKAMIAGALSPQLPQARRLALASAIHSELSHGHTLSFGNPQLASSLAKAARKLVPELKDPLDRKAITELQREYKAQPDNEAELAVLYRAQDLQQVNPDLTFRVNLELKLA